jgi:hypothetical protein
VFAAVLNTSVSTVQKWEIGEKRPSGPSLKLLNVIERKGIKALACVQRAIRRTRVEPLQSVATGSFRGSEFALQQTDAVDGNGVRCPSHQIFPIDDWHRYKPPSLCCRSSGR